VAVIAAIIQIRQLVRRPAQKVGFIHDPGGRDTRLLRVKGVGELAVRWSRRAPVSDPIELTVVAINNH
jgi:hypothetical protein